MSAARRRKAAARPEPFLGPDGVLYQPVRVAQSPSFALALLGEWRALDGVNRGYLYRGAAFNVPVPIYERIEGPARARLRRQGEVG